MIYHVTKYLLYLFTLFTIHLFTGYVTLLIVNKIYISTFAGNVNSDARNLHAYGIVGTRCSKKIYEDPEMVEICLENDDAQTLSSPTIKQLMKRRVEKSLKFIKDLFFRKLSNNTVGDTDCLLHL